MLGGWVLVRMGEEVVHHSRQDWIIGANGLPDWLVVLHSARAAEEIGPSESPSARGEFPDPH